MATSILLFGVVGKDIIAEDIVSRIDAVNDDRIDLRIHSAGGSVLDGFAIFAALQRNPATIVAHIDGWAASIMSYVMLAADKIIAGRNSMILIHNAQAGLMGGAEDFDRAAAIIRTHSTQLAEAYIAKTGLPEARIRAMMDSETRMTAAEALRLGFVDEIEENTIQVAALMQLEGFALDNETNAGEGIMPDTKTIKEAVAEARQEVTAKFEAEIGTAKEAHLEAVAILGKQLDEAKAEAIAAVAQVTEMTAKVETAEKAQAEAVARAETSKTEATAALARVEALSGGLSNDDSGAPSTFKHAEDAVAHFRAEGMNQESALLKVMNEYPKLHAAWIDEATASNPHR